MLRSNYYVALLFAGCHLLVIGSAVAASYELPPTKMGIEPCRTAAIALHPGRIEKFRIGQDAGIFYIVYEIRSRDDVTWVVRCEAKTGRVISDVKQ